MTVDDLVRLATTVATTVRQRVPRSSNRYMERPEAGSTWLKSGIPEYVDLLHTLGRTASAAKTGVTPTTAKVGGKVEDTKRVHHLFVKSDVKVKQLKQAVLDFVQKKQVDLSYKRGLEEEKRYSQQFATELAAYLNGKGFRDNGHKFAAHSVISRLKLKLVEHQRLQKYAVDYSTHANPGKSGFSTLQFPVGYVLGNARNALRFGVGNCEEVGSAAFAMILHAHGAGGAPIVAPSATPRRVELVYAKAAAGDAHFFVLLNRKGANSVGEDLDVWIRDSDTIVCDPWFTDRGLGGRITGPGTDMAELQNWLLGEGAGDPVHIATRATGFVGQGLPATKDVDAYRIPWT